MNSKYLGVDTLRILDKVVPRMVEATSFRIVQSCTLAIPNRVGSSSDWWRHASPNSINSREYWVGRMALECRFGNHLIGWNEFVRRNYSYAFFKQKNMIVVGCAM